MTTTTNTRNRGHHPSSSSSQETHTRDTDSNYPLPLPLPRDNELGPKKSAAVLIIIVACFALLWPKLLSPLFGFGAGGGGGAPAARVLPHPRALMDQGSGEGCCDVVWENDINAIKIMTELCSNILKRQDTPDWKTQNALSTGILTKEIIGMCRREVNTTCGIDISTFLDHNIRLGKTYKQILDEVRSYNSSICLKRNFGVAPWALGVPHLVGKFWMQGALDSIRQERSPHLRAPPIHPALRERGRAIPTVPGAGGPQTVPIVQKEGRVWSSPLSVYFVRQLEEPMSIGMRPPMGGAGGVVPPPKSSVGFVMPVYTFCIIVFFMYTIFKLLFRRTGSGDSGQYESFKSDPEFRRKIFDEAERDSEFLDRASLERSKLGDEELDQLKARLAETERAMERIMKHMRGPLIGQDVNLQPISNGRLHTDKLDSLLSESKDSSLHKENTPPSWESLTPSPRDAINEFLKSEEANSALILQEITNKEEDEKLKEHKDELIHQMEKDKAAVKVVGMEITAHPEGGRRWVTRPDTPPVTPLPPRPPTPLAEVSSIILEGHLPHVSKLLVSDSEIVTEPLHNGEDKDTPIVLSGKMTLSVINDESSKTTPERDNAIIEDSLIEGDDDEFLTASAATAPKQTEAEYEDESEEELEIEEEEEEIEEVEEEEEEEEEED